MCNIKCETSLYRNNIGSLRFFCSDLNTQTQIQINIPRELMVVSRAAVFDATPPKSRPICTSDQTYLIIQRQTLQSNSLKLSNVKLSGRIWQYSKSANIRRLIA